MADRSEMHTKMKGRNFAVLGVLIVLVIIVAVSTYIKFGGSF